MYYDDFEKIAEEVNDLINEDWDFNFEGTSCRVNSRERAQEIINLLSDYIVDWWDDGDEYIILITGTKLKMVCELKLRKKGNSFVLGYISPKDAEYLMQYGSQFNVTIEEL
jgi:hypothetical protein